MGEQKNIESALWEQRVDPWMVFWPLLMLGLSGLLAVGWVIGSALPDPMYLALEISNIDQDILTVVGSDMARISVAFVGIGSIVVGLLLYLRLTAKAVNEDETELSISKRFVLLVLLWDLIPAGVYAIIILTPLQLIFGRFLLDIALCFFYGMAFSIGIGFVVDFFNFSAKAKATNSRVDMYVLRKGSPPSVIVDATDIIGGYIYMFIDTRVVKAVMRIVSVPFRQST
ncbi:MAG: hypothetical protein KAR33_10220 [Candidatus Thorarchaeota archaeon]|nr:hypothetical protein [Candidatus Thorarchaeota archaeon]